MVNNMSNTLYELGVEYAESAEPIRKRLSELRTMLKTETNSERIWHIKRRIAELTPMLTYCNRVSEYCKNYYVPGFYIGDGCTDFRRVRRPAERANEKAVLESLQGEANQLSKSSVPGDNSRRKNNARTSNGNGAKQVHYLQELAKSIKEIP